MKTVIISDTHLKFSENNEDIERRKRVSSFLQTLENNTDRLILAGDFFDLWYDWQSVIIKNYFSILYQLRKLRDSGCEIVLTTGNHDFWFNGFLENEIGIEIRDEFSFVSSGKKILVLHGDQYTSNDKRYLLFRSFIRNRLVKKIFEFIHPNIGLFFGKQLSRSSRDRKRKKSISNLKEQGLIDYAQKMLKQYDYVVMGHTHKPQKIEFSNGCYINSGDWITHNSYVVIENDVVELSSYDD